MCGRYAIFGPISRHRKDEQLLLQLLDRTTAFTPHYNAAPTQYLPVYRIDPERGPELTNLKWGLIPSWAKDQSIGPRLIIARSESVQEKPSFRSAFRYRRCLIPANGFYEWQALPSGKQPYYITVHDVGIIAFAGLWESWKDKKTDDVIDSFAIITCEANDLLKPLHERMPVILKEADYQTWLTGRVAEAKTLLRPFPADEMEAYFVSTKVNRASYDGPDVITPIDDPDEGCVLLDKGTEVFI
jgi:putative SOS response-associated peptidase YedK